MCSAKRQFTSPYPGNGFIATHLPDWLASASAQQVKRLQGCVTEHLRSQQQIARLSGRLQPPGQFAQQLLQPAIAARLGQAVELDKAVWREARLKVIQRPFQPIPGLLPPDFETRFVYEPLLQKLLQNFTAGETFAAQTVVLGPQAAGEQAATVLTSKIADVVDVCRKVDAGAAYQTHLAQVLGPAVVAALAQDKCRELALAIELASLKGHLNSADSVALRLVSEDKPALHPQGLLVRTKMLEILGSRVDGALAFELLVPTLRQGDFPVGPPDRLKAMIIYLPGVGAAPLRRFANWQAINQTLASELTQAPSRQALLQRIALADRARFQALLAARLSDSRPDLQPGRAPVTGKWFTDMATWQVRRIKQDALFLVVPSAQADSEASAQRLASLAAAGIGLLNLAGLFVPVVGTLLLADLGRQVLGHVYEGVSDWAQEHQHEALQHLLAVAGTVAAAGAASLAASTLRSTFVETLEPVTTEHGTEKLWSRELATYRQVPTGVKLTERHDGLFSGDEALWWHHEGKFYGVYQDSKGGWRLLHRDGPQVFGPLLRGNGERGWWLSLDRPQQWQGSAPLLARLWPAARALSDEQVAQVLQVAGADDAKLRQLAVECLPLPVTLRDTLERFAVHGQNQAFFNGSGEGSDYAARLDWCSQQLGVPPDAVAEQTTRVMAQAGHLREAMLAHFAEQYLPDDPLWPLFKRHFPHLPKAYALDILKAATSEMRSTMHNTSRMPLALALPARLLQQQARLTRLREAVCLQDSYSDDVVSVVFRLLQRQGLAADQVDLVLHQRSSSGPVLERLLPAFGQVAQSLHLVRSAGRFELYDQAGRRSGVEIAQPQGLFEVLAACLSPAYLRRMQWVADDAPQLIRAQVQAWLPTQPKALLALLGWREARPLGASLQRLDDGRVGYPLGPVLSCLESPECVMRRRIHALYPSLNEAQTEHYLDLLYQHTASPFSSLLRLELEYDQLTQQLNAWARHASTHVREQRVQACREFQRAWRMETYRLPARPQRGRDAHLSLVSIALGELPALPPGTDFGHIDQLTLINLRLSALPPAFLSFFPNVQVLNLAFNELQALPAGLENLSQLRELNLAGNHIRLDEAQAAVLAVLTGLRNLNLSDNPLDRATLQIGALRSLETLSLRRVGLAEMPEGLELCEQLTYIDLRNNQISGLPQALIDSPVPRRQLLILSGNPLSADVMDRLRNPAHPGQPTLVELEPVVSKYRWLGTLESPQRQAHEALWDAVRVEAGSDPFFALLDELVESADFRVAPQETGRRVWRVVTAASNDARVRSDLFDLAGDPRTCADSAAHCFSQLEVGMHVAEFTHNGEPGATAKQRLILAQRLFRLNQVDQFARADMDARYADGRWERGQHDEEEVEVSLAYRVGLSQRLNLLGQPGNMLFGELAQVSPAALDNAYSSVLTAEAGEERAAFISKLGFWVMSLRALHPSLYSAIEDDFLAQWQAVEAHQQAQRSHEAALGDPGYLQQARDLQQARTRALGELSLRLTKEALARPV
ncbi:NEL-type E3 ubiquitin ligase domain-containing protein [Pseudomonas sp. NPDC089408]|uniref:NEL-type E3 ubiquitin ligase domain-containing protein n=1 Tax=Pseudomonas sp. NPDC089408 TaxID=3364465 RepID=UPI0037F7ED84